MDEPPRLIDSPADFAAAWPDLRHTAVIGLELTAERLNWAEARVDGATFLGCTFPSGVTDRLTAAGATAFSPLTDLPFQPYRSDLYRYEELTSGHERGVSESLDMRISSWFESSSPTS